MPGHRCFIAIRMSEDVLTAVGDLLGELRGAGADVKWVRPEALHLTLKFLGEISSEQVETVKRILVDVAATSQPFDLKVSDIGGFPSLRSPRVIWAGISSAAELGDLQAKLEDALAARGFDAESRAFTPHLTLGRMRSRKNAEDALRILEGAVTRTFGKVEVTEVVLMESYLKPGGAEHLPLLEAKLGAGS